MARGYLIAFAAVLLLAGLLDAATASSPLVLASFAVAAVAATASSRARAVTSWAAAGSSLGLTVATVLDPGSTGTSVPVGTAEALALTLLVLTTTRRAERWRGWSLTTATALAVVCLPVRLGWSPDSPTLVAGTVVLSAVAVAVGSALRGADAARRAAVTAVRRREREEVARELHDVVAHHVTGMVVATQAARLVATRSDARLDPTLAAIEGAGAEALAAMRRLVEVLRTDPDDRLAQDGADGDGTGERTPVPQAEDLVDLVRRFRGVTTGRVELLGDPRELADLPVDGQVALYRATQEALTNTARHAPAADLVQVEVVRHGGTVSVEITDSGAAGARRREPAGPAGGGFGLIGMRERLDALGGSLNAGPHGKGWRVSATLPHPTAGAEGQR
ncbi:sensor histidine kinase [Kineococcus radiotolerans]|uniref:histidine kinase n=1 Tax=Kineococcus radiotolerans (strain ATCC BAA-149 / DSM 14245 / SRS30216) TaxID=266940 RepID=A6WB05_KINRD|nr:histidine kinase [Kineococcus radiotolerans]ABS03994.1 integral membrane sensor signal transduction histidine kinase [Kineococcus radiotolerans SRS30216 = ATCC BAA-149]